MRPFDDYSRYYNLLYKDKDYSGETEYIASLITENMHNARDILDLGCGTGRHAFLLAEKNYNVCGVDISKEMLSFADKLPPKSNLRFTEGDIRTLELNHAFDVVISLFHVISYQTSNDDLLNTFATVHRHLNPQGLFLFDCWYGPAVLTDPPVTRIKRLEDDECRIIRIAEPVMHPNDNVVDVNYQVIIQSKHDSFTRMIQETHKMRYLFAPEVETFLRKANLTMLGCYEWMSRKEPDFNTWNVIFVVQK